MIYSTIFGDVRWKKYAQGIHGILFYEFERKIYYPTRKDIEAANPDGSQLR
jgi:hypothetical protein